MTEQKFLFDVELKDGCLVINQQPILTDVPANIKLIPHPAGTGAFFQLSASKPSHRLVFPLGNLTGIRRLTCCHRYEPFWMTAKNGTRGGQVPIETQFLMCELDEQCFIVFVPIIDGTLRGCLQGTGEDGLELVAETGDVNLQGQQLTGLYLAAGSDPYKLIKDGAISLMRWMKTGRLRHEKSLPGFIDQFGWCTWDAFYTAVSPELVQRGLESFAAGGVQPKFLLLDDGWQSVRSMPAGENRLTGFAANEKFPGDLSVLIRTVKQEFGIETFLVWHAMIGYWGGVDDEALPGYGVRTECRDWSPGILHYYPEYNDKWGNQVGVVSPDAIHRFFNDYHRHLRQQGVDGVKVDNQSVLEAVSRGSGGRVAMMQRYHEALEGSAQTHFLGTLINCMSNANEMIYSALNSNLLRSSIDFWPNIPESHGDHMYANAQVGLWFGEFIHPDWDMFQSGHPMGALHAAGRAVSGGPVYVSDKPGVHNFDLLRKLVLADGSVLRARHPGRPTRDCLFANPVMEPVLLKVFNHNLDAGVIGAFNVHYLTDHTHPGIVSGSVRPLDVEGLVGDRFVVLEHSSRKLRVLGPLETWDVSLPTLSAEIYTIVPIREQVAPLGLVDLFNSSAAVLEKGWINSQNYHLQVRGPGRCWIWCQEQPRRVRDNLADVPFNYLPEQQVIEFELLESGVHTVVLEF